MNYEKVVFFDIETNGLLPDLDRVHLLTVKPTGGAVSVYRRNEAQDTIEVGLRHMMNLAEDGWLCVGHNVIKFDIPAIQKVYPWFDLPKAQVFDTLVFARLKFADLSDVDSKLVAKEILPRNLFGSHKLEAWGLRVGEFKGEYEGDTRIADEKERKRRKWEAWNPDMEAYGIQDVVTTEAVFLKLNPAAYSQEAVELEHAVAWIVARQERNGYCFDEAAAASLYAELSARRAEIDRELRDTVPGAFWPVGPTFVPKKDSKAHGYVAGAALTKVAFKDFNPTSRAHIARFLKRRYGWKPMKFTEGGDPAVDDEVLVKLPYPEAKLLAEMFLIEKRIGMLAEGNQAWMKVVKNGRIHGSVTTNGAVTGRMTHAYPNVAQVPKVGTQYGAECRRLFRARPGWKLVGADASGLELRCLAHFMGRWDAGRYATAVVEGKEEDGTDVHSLNAKALGMEPQTVYTIGGKQMKGRNCAKTFIYAFLYGAGAEKIGSIVGKSASYGAKLKASFLAKTPALKKLIAAVAEAVAERGFLKGLDGRILHVRSKHAALNTLLQSAGAIVMKKALVLLDEALQAAGYVPGEHYEFVANVHDEFQIETLPEIADHVGRLAVQSIRLAGEHFGFRCPLDGAYKVGDTWADTH